MNQSFEEIAEEIPSKLKMQVVEDYLHFKRRGNFPKVCFLRDFLEEKLADNPEDNPEEKFDINLAMEEIPFYVCLSIAKNWIEVEKIYLRVHSDT